MTPASLTAEERAEQRAAIQRLIEERFGAGHDCCVDLGAMLRVEGDNSVRFQHEGSFWDLKRAGGQFSLNPA